MTSLTRRAIKEAFLRLLEKKPLNKITVRDIVEECGISRNTFYYHFEDVPSLLNTVFIEATDEIIVKHADTETLNQCVAMAVDFAIHNKKIVMNIYRSASREIYEMHLSRVIDHAIEAYAAKVHQDIYDDLKLSEADQQIILRILRAAVFGLVIDWLDCDMSYDIVGDLKRYQTLRADAYGKAIDSLI